MRIGVIFDPHVSDKAPSTRKDDYRSAILRKLDFCVQEANTRRYAALLISGDLFHRKIPAHNSHALISNLLAIFEQAKMPIICIAGNHDISGNMTTFAQQPMFVLKQAGVLSLMDNDKPIVLTEGQTTVSINGAAFSSFRDKKDAATLYNLNHADNAVKIGLFHQMILPDGDTFFSDYINFSDLLSVNSDIIVDGHYHVGFDPSLQEVNGKYFLNGGALSRGSSENFNLNKVPCYVELSVEQGLNGLFSVTAEDIPVPHKKAEDIFDFVAIKRKKDDKVLQSFIQNLSEFEVASLSSTSPDGVLRILKTMGMEDRLLSKAEMYLTSASERIN